MKAPKILTILIIIIAVANVYIRGETERCISTGTWPSCSTSMQNTALSTTPFVFWSILIVWVVFGIVKKIKK